MYIHTNTRVTVFIAALLFLSSILGVQATASTFVDSRMLPSKDGVIRTADRLQKRLSKHYNITVEQSRLVDAVMQRRTMLSHPLSVNLNVPDGLPVETWIISLQEHPEWMHAVITKNFEYKLDSLAIQLSVADRYLAEFPPPVNAIVSEIWMDRTVEKVKSDTIAKPGFTFKSSAVAASIVQAFQKGSTLLTVTVEQVPGKITNATGKDLGNLELLATGRSNFAGSGEGRKSNVRKGLNKDLTNTLVPPGATFSFNETLNNMRGGGWELALGIFNGKQLRMIPGGGICQVATTAYRSILNAGLPILERKPHSLFVHYYEKFGVGLDATVFPKAQDLSFLNDTGHYLLIQSYTDGDDAFVHVYGTSDGRTAYLEGPYFSENAPADFMVKGRTLRSNEIGWIQHIRFADGREVQNTIFSQYDAVPRSVVREYTAEKVALAQ